MPKNRPKSKCDKCGELHITKKLTFFKGKQLCFKCHPHKMHIRTTNDI